MQASAQTPEASSTYHHRPVNTSRVGGKRTSKEAENDSASILIPRQMERQQSSITTPNVSSNLSEILQNCKQINDL